MPTRITGTRQTGLHAISGTRKYLNGVERGRFVRAARQLPTRERLFCLMILWSGARISEALALTPAAIDVHAGVVRLETLKRRQRGLMREVPLPAELLEELDRVFCIGRTQRNPELREQRLWPWSRTTAWRYIKAAMKAAAIEGGPAMPKGLRHTFGVSAFQANVPQHLVQRWLGHASPRTTAIYGDVAGPEEREFAARMWDREVHRGNALAVQTRTPPRLRKYL